MLATTTSAFEPKIVTIIVESIDQKVTTTTLTSPFTTQAVSPSVSISHDVSTDNNSSSVGVIVVIVVLVVVVFIIIVVVGIIVIWKRMKTQEHIKQEAVYYSTINETSLSRSPTSKPYSGMNDGQDNKEPQYIDITKQLDKVAMQDNPAYSAACEHQVELQDNPAYCTSSGQQVKMQDNPAYSISSTNDFDTDYM